MLVRAKKKRLTKGSRDVRPVTRCIFLTQQVCEYFNNLIPAACVLYNECGQLSR